MLSPSPNNSLCLAKWLQVTIDLHNGVSKSCHHTRWTKIDVNAAVQNPIYLHNTPAKEDERSEMLKGIKTKSCSFCWEYEKKVSPTSSDRFSKSSSDWAIWGQKNGNLNIDLPIPSYVEVMFDKVCNLRCVYCSPDSSSSIENEIIKYGEYSSEVKEHRSIRLTKSNHKDKLIETFFSWLPSLIPKLNTLRVTGGEPLLSKNTYKLMDYLIGQSSRHLTFSINSNLCLSKKSIEYFSKKINLLTPQIKRFHLYTSIESFGDEAEFIRYGMDYGLFIANLTLLLEKHNDIDVTIISTINKLSCSHLLTYLKEVSKLKGVYKNLNIDFALLEQPDFLSVKNLSPKEMLIFEDCAYYLQREKNSFNVQEISKFMGIMTVVRKSKINDVLNRKYSIFMSDYKDKISKSMVEK